MNHSLKNPDAHRRLARGANAGVWFRGLGRRYMGGAEFESRQMWLDFQDAVGTALQAIANGVDASRKAFKAWLRAFRMPAPVELPSLLQLQLFVMEGVALDRLVKPVLVGCEESQTICKAFREAGYEAYSCDLAPTRGNPAWHYQQDIMEVIPTRQWGLIILHPDCTAMAVSGNRWYGHGMPMHHKRQQAIEWTVRMWELAKMYGDRVALENPVSVIFRVFVKEGCRAPCCPPMHTIQNS